MLESTRQSKRRYQPELKLKIVREAMAGPQSKAAIARKYDINANQVSNWIREYREQARWVSKANASILPVIVDASDARMPQGATHMSVHEPPVRSAVSTLSVVFSSGHQLTMTQATEQQIAQIIQALT